MQLAGELSKISLPSLTQLLRNGGLSGKVCLTQGTNTAFIYVRDGRIIHVETDAEHGRAALLELFLWLDGTFSFVEANLENIPESFPSDEPIEKTLREGMAYLERKKHLDQLRVNSRTVLRRTSELSIDNPIWARLDGRRTLADISYSASLSRYELINLAYTLLINGHASVVEAQSFDDTVTLPRWVTSRLQQDNPDLTQAIVEMVIWVDRVKCWMYQADADMEKIVGQLKSGNMQDSALDKYTATVNTQPPRTGFSVAAIVADLQSESEDESTLPSQ